MKSDRVLGVSLTRHDELLRDLPLRIAQNHASLTLSLCLGLHRHGVLQARRNEHVLNLYRNDVDTPRFGALIDDRLQLLTELFPTFKHVRKLSFADDIP